MMNRCFSSALLLAFLSACGSSGSSPHADTPDASGDGAPSVLDSGSADVGPADGGVDAPATDAGTPDGEVGDAGSDATLADGGALDANASPDGDDLDAGSTQAPDAAPISLEVGDGGVASFDMVSPDRCVHKAGLFVECNLPAITIHDPNAADAGAPVKTTFTTQMTGNCSSAFALQVSVSATDLPGTIYHLSDMTMDVRRLDRTAIGDLQIGDDTSLHNLATYADTCHMWVGVEMNEVDTF